MSFVQKLKLPYIVVGFLILQLLVNGMGLNGPHIDEATHFIAGNEVLHGNLSGGYITWFAGSPFLWPVLSAIGFQNFGGLFGSRLMATLLQLISLYAVGRFSINLTNRTAGTLAALMFAVFGPFMHLAHFAVYDNGAVVGVTVCAWLLSEKATDRRRLQIALAGIVLSFGVISKIPMLLMFAPLTGLLIVMGFNQRRSFKQVIGDLLIFGVTTAVPFLIYLALTWNMGMSEWWKWGNEHRNAFGATSLSLIIGFAWFSLIPLALGILSGIIHIRRWAIYLVLALGSFLIWPVYHALSVNGSADQKHVIMSVLLLYPLVGLLLETLSSKKIIKYLVPVIIVVAAGYGLLQMTRLDHSWNDSRPGARYLAAISQPGDKILIADAWSTLPYLMEAGKLANRYDVADLWTVDNITDFKPCETVKWLVDLEGSTYTYRQGYMDELRACGFKEVYRSSGYITPGNQLGTFYNQDTVIYLNSKFSIPQ